ncbi:MAG: small basic protein [Candidatus Omnitrophica bacterium]|nr:small basic protein [Candidatus Omnitrophota bacterium]
MSQHPSLLGSQKGKQHRSVIKRYEKLKQLVEKDKWEEEKNSIYKLPKIKSIRFKVKKEKAAEKEAGPEGAAPAAAGQAQAAQATAKPGAKEQKTKQKA